MPTREELLEEVRRKRLMEEVARKRAAEENAPQEAAPSTVEEEPSLFSPEPGATRIEPKEYTGPVEYGTAAQLATSVPLIGSAVKAGTMRFRALADQEDGESYDQALARHNKKFASDRDAFERDYPAAGPIASIAGSLALPGVKAAGALGKWVGVPAYNAAESAVDNLLMKEDSEEAMQSGVTAGGVSTALNLGGGAGKLLGAGLRRFGAGITKDVADYYKANADRINSLDFEKIVGRYMRRQDILDKAGVQAKNRAAEAAAAHNLTAAAEKTRLEKVAKLTADDTARNLALGVMDARQEVGKRLGKESQAMVPVLDRDIQRYPWDQWTKRIEDAIEEQKVTRAAPEHDPTIQMLRNWQKRFQAADESQARGRVAKSLQEEMGQDLDNAYSAAESRQYVSKSDHPLMSLRGQMRKDLGTMSKEYDDRMAAQAERTSRKVKMDDWGDTSVKVGKNFSTLDNPNYAANRQLLDWLGKETGRDFLTPLRPAEDARKLLEPANWSDHVRRLPSQKAVDETRQQVGKIKESRKVFAGPLKSRIEALGNDINDQERLARLQEVGRWMGFDPQELAKDLSTRAALRKVRTGDPIFMPTTATGAAAWVARQGTKYGAPMYKSFADNVLLNPALQKQKKRLDWLMPKVPRAIMTPYNREYLEEQELTEEGY